MDAQNFISPNNEQEEPVVFTQGDAQQDIDLHAKPSCETASECCVPETLDTAENTDSAIESAEIDAETVNVEAETVELSELDLALLKVAELEEKLARANADYYNLQQEYQNYVRRSKGEIRTQYEQGISKVLEVLLPVLDNADLARQHDDLQGTAGKVVTELEDTLKANYQLERFTVVGDEFDPQIHEALMHQTSPDVSTEQVAQVIQAGYKQGEKVLRPARVGVVSPE